MKWDEIMAKANMKRSKPRDEEHRIQCACVRWFHYYCPHLRGLLFAVPNGGRRDATTGAKLKAEGVVPGVSDLILLVPRHNYHGLCIEMKAAHGRQSDEQKAFQARVEQQGYKYIICRSAEDFANQVREYVYIEEDRL